MTRSITASVYKFEGCGYDDVVTGRAVTCVSKPARRVLRRQID